jgi:hypothetical protein
MMLSFALLASLVLYAIVASQPLFYFLSLGPAQRRLSAPAYIELRQALNPLMVRRVPVLYLGTLAALVLTILLSWRSPASLVAGPATTALILLVVDAFLMARSSVPINTFIDSWTPEKHPADWELHRDRWFAIFRYRQAALLTGLFGLLSGAVLRP